jgi:hypothetical protein
MNFPFLTSFWEAGWGGWVKFLSIFLAFIYLFCFLRKFGVNGSNGINEEF